jgi:hypothetical protein
MTRAPHAAQINLRFGNAAREFLDFRASVRSGHFARERLNFLRQIGVDKNGQAQPVAVRISRRAGSALSGRRACACACIRAIGAYLARRAHAAVFVLSDWASMSLNPASSACCAARRSSWPQVVRCRSTSRRIALRRTSAVAIMRSMRSMSSYVHGEPTAVNDKVDGRQLHLWRGQDLVENLIALADSGCLVRCGAVQFGRSLILAQRGQARSGHQKSFCSSSSPSMSRPSGWSTAGARTSQFGRVSSARSPPVIGPSRLC